MEQAETSSGPPDLLVVEDVQFLYYVGMQAANAAEMPRWMPGDERAFWLCTQTTQGCCERG